MGGGLVWSNGAVLPEQGCQPHDTVTQWLAEVAQGGRTSCRVSEERAELPGLQSVRHCDIGIGIEQAAMPLGLCQGKLAIQYVAG